MHCKAERATPPGNGSDETPGVAEVTPAADADGGSEDLAKLPMEKNCTSYLVVPVKWLKFWLSHMEPVAFSVNNLKSLVRRGSREVTRDELLKLLEFVVGVESAQAISPDERQPGVLLHRLLDTNISMGRKGRDLVIPPDWSTDGEYLLHHDGETTYLVHRFSESKIDLADFIEDETLLSSDGMMQIDNNWSELRATLKRADGLFLFRCSALLSGMTKSSTPTKVQRGASAMCLAPPVLPPSASPPPKNPSGKSSGRQRQRNDEAPPASVAKRRKVSEVKKESDKHDEASFRPPRPAAKKAGKGGGGKKVT